MLPNGAGRQPKLTLTAEAWQLLRQLRKEVKESVGKLPRLTQGEVVALTLGEPESDDVIIKDNGFPLLAVSRDLMDRLGEGSQLQIVGAPDGEPIFKIVQGPTAAAQVGGSSLSSEGKEGTMRSPRVLVVWVVFLVTLVLWILGLALGWGGWVWAFFGIGLAALVANLAALVGARRR